MAQVKFGTSGWRGVLAYDFTWRMVQATVEAIAAWLHREGQARQGVVVGCDARFQGDLLSRLAAQILDREGVPVFFCPGITPTPTIATEIQNRNAGGAVNFTASHNPPEYQGLKFSTDWAGAALPEVSTWVAQEANTRLARGLVHELTLEEAAAPLAGADVDAKPYYFRRMRDLVDFNILSRAPFAVAMDPMYGAGRGYLDTLLREAGIEVRVLHDHYDPMFGGHAPDPSEANLAELSEMVRGDDGVGVGLAVDGDADRFGIIDADGAFWEPNYVLALIYDYLIADRGRPGDAARNVATTHWLDRVAAYHSRRVHETPVGFKYLGEHLVEGSAIMACEESAGLSLQGHIPEKDGMLACLLTLEMMVERGGTLRELVAELEGRIGPCRTRRVNIHLTSRAQAAFRESQAGPPPGSFAGRRVEDIVTMDGRKFLLEDGSWLLMRESGTEPLVRLYLEAETEAALDEITRAGEAYIRGE